MIRNFRFLSFSLLFLTSACATFDAKNTILEKERVRRVKAERKLANIQKSVLDLKTENGILARALEQKKLEDPDEPSTFRSDMNSTDPIKQNETLLYQKIVDAYKSKDESAMKSMQSLLKKAFPNSRYHEDGFYLQGLLAYHQGKWTESLEIFDQLLQNFPNTSRKRDAYLAKALVYKKLNLPDQARAMLQSAQSAPKKLSAKNERDSKTNSK